MKTFIAAAIVLLCSTAWAGQQPGRVLIFSDRTVVPAASYMPLAAESAHYDLKGVRELDIEGGHCALSADQPADAGFLEAAQSTLGIGLYDAQDNYLAELYLSYQSTPGGTLRAPLTWWGGIVAVQKDRAAIDLTHQFAGGTPPQRFSVGLDADVWNSDLKAPHAVDSYCVLLVDLVR